MNKYTEDIIALHQFDADAQRESLDKLKEDKNIEKFLEKQAIIGQLFRQGMTEAQALAKGIITTPPE